MALSESEIEDRFPGPDLPPARRDSVAFLPPWSVTRVLAIAAAVLVGLSTVGQILTWVAGHDTAMGFVPLFHVATEPNIPTYFSALILLFAAVLLAIIGWHARRESRPLSRYWLGLACLFTYLSVDEAAMLHERTIEPLRELLGVGGLLYFAWVIPASILVILVVVILIPFLRKLPTRTFRLFLLSGVLFVGGAIGMELLGGLYWEQYDGRSAIWSVLTTIEETLEIAGVLVFIHALLLHLRDNAPELRIRFQEGSARS